MQSSLPFGVLRFSFLFSCCALLAPGGEWDREKDKLIQSCGDPAAGFAEISSCGGFLFNGGAPLRFIIPQSVVPGGGSALGLTFIQPVDLPNWAGSNFTMTGGSSLREFWFGDAALTLSHRAWGGLHTSARDRFTVQVYGHAWGLPTMPFYGIGPNTARSNLTDFQQRDFWTGVRVFNPVNRWLNFSASGEFLKPQVSGVHDPTVRSIDQFYSEATAPGLTYQPGFGHYMVGVLPNYSWTRTKISSEIAFHEYQDAGSGHYSFHKFRADFLQSIYPETQHEATAGGHGKVRAQPRYDSVLSIAGRFSASTATGGNVVPFYLQETLGGSDIDNVATLRGFQDYRFRAPNLFSIQAQYERRLLPATAAGADVSTVRRVAGALGVMAFYDAGEVADTMSQLSFDKVRHSFGFGLNFWSGEKVWFRAYVGLGSGEGVHNFVGVVNPNVQSPHL